MNLAMTDLFFQQRKNLRSCCLWGSVSICRWILRNCPSRRFQSLNQRRRDFLGRSFLEPSFRPESFPFRPFRPDIWYFCFRGPFHGASAWCRPLDCSPKKKRRKGHAKMARGSRYASQPVSLEWKDSFGNTKEATWYGMIYGFMDSDSEQWDTFEFWILDFQEKMASYTITSIRIASFSHVFCICETFCKWWDLELWGMVEMTQMPRPLALHQWTAQQPES